MISTLFQSENYFFKTVLLLLLLSILHIIAIVINNGMPFGLLYGPLLFSMHLSLTNCSYCRRKIVFLSLPFWVFFSWYFILKVKKTSIEEMLESYYFWYFILMIISLLVIPTVVLTQKKKWVAPVSHLKSVMIQQLSVISIVISFFIISFFMQRYIVVQFDISLQFMILMLLVLSFIVLFRYVYQELVWEYQIVKKHKQSIKQGNLAGKVYSLPLEILENYAERLHNCLKGKSLYLRPDLSLELLAQETKIPRHHFSELLNGYLGKSYYQLIAEYRIESAINRLKENEFALTIEALAYESGFNSKTSFNKHFKEITGSLPSEFRNQQSL